MSSVKVYWVTGASSGIGEALCLEISKQRSELILSSRNLEKMKSLAKQCEKNGSICHVVPLDLTQEKTIELAFETVQQKVNKIDFLINNGGISQRSMVLDTKAETERRIFEVNYFGTTSLTRKVLAWMLETGGGNISVVSSIAGKFGFPLRSAYSAVKHALVGYFETLHLEYSKNGVHTTIIFPGRVNTSISKNALDGNGLSQNQMDKGQSNGIPAQKCAFQMLKAIHKDKREVYIGGKELLMVKFRKYWPAMFRKIAMNTSPT